MSIDDKKIEKLFNYRKIPYVLKDLAIINSKALLSDLYELQRNIYALDHYLESNWKLSSSNLNKHWKAIYNTLEKLGYNRSQAQDLCKHIKKYELHEIQLREGKRPYRLSMEYFYYYKSCDVRLMRQILVDKSIKTKSKLADWRYFDLATEVNDDIEDVFEDMETINANAFLILINERSVNEAHDKFDAFLKHIEHKSSLRRSKVNTKAFNQIHNWTVEIIADTSKLMLENLKKIKSESLETRGKLEIHSSRAEV